MSNLKNTLPGTPGNETAWIYWQVRPYIRPTWYPAVSAGESVIRLSLGKLLVNLLQVVKRTNTPLITLTNGVVDRPWVFGSWVRSPPSTIINFSDFPPACRTWKTLSLVSPGNETAWFWVNDRSARVSGRPAIPPFQGGRSVIRLSWGKLLVNQLQVVKRSTNTPLIP